MNSNPSPTATPPTKYQAAQESRQRGCVGDSWYFDHPFYCIHCDVKLTRKNWFPKNWGRTDEWWPSRWSDTERRLNKFVDVCEACNTPEATERRDRVRMEIALKAYLEEHPERAPQCHEYPAEKI